MFSVYTLSETMKYEGYRMIYFLQNRIKEHRCFVLDI